MVFHMIRLRPRISHLVQTIEMGQNRLETPENGSKSVRLDVKMMEIRKSCYISIKKRDGAAGI
jgi:hypothetical protein